MAFVIIGGCSEEKAADCVDVCPVDCIQEGPDQYYIDADICIDCGACEAACPVGAVAWEDDLNDDDKIYMEKAANFYKQQ
ncbi:indolepyruvate ferredoxin oxidoreductase subunit alpha [Paenibacillus eucommiae]|uniref:indolepyruvate ferredoxin oxidoreductase subunit alpha n=1 Tax=Paenibacillus eucommiae TaxID=1355755 RepID=UPI001AE703DB|nr:4Fe-4S binding protein [Paenibacillus eucommiae]